MHSFPLKANPPLNYRRDLAVMIQLQVSAANLPVGFILVLQPLWLETIKNLIPDLFLPVARLLNSLPLFLWRVDTAVSLNNDDIQHVFNDTVFCAHTEV